MSSDLLRRLQEFASQVECVADADEVVYLADPMVEHARKLCADLEKASPEERLACAEPAARVVKALSQYIKNASALRDNLEASLNRRASAEYVCGVYSSRSNVDE